MMTFTPPPWYSYIDLEKVANDDVKLLASIIGDDLTKRIICEFPKGTTFVIPQNCIISAKRKYIKDNYDGSKYSRRKLALECDVSENYIFRTVRRKF